MVSLVLMDVVEDPAGEGASKTLGIWGGHSDKAVVTEITVNMIPPW
jgi:hypothetical protein